MCVLARRIHTYSLLTCTTPPDDFEHGDVHTKHARNEKHLNSTKRNAMKRRIRAIYYYWYYNTRSSRAGVKQNKRLRVYQRKIQNFSNYLPFGNDANFGNYTDAADVIIRNNRSRKNTSSKYNIFATSPLPRSASIRVHIEVPNV